MPRSSRAAEGCIPNRFDSRVSGGPTSQRPRHAVMPGSSFPYADLDVGFSRLRGTCSLPNTRRCMAGKKGLFACSRSAWTWDPPKKRLCYSSESDLENRTNGRRRNRRVRKLNVGENSQCVRSRMCGECGFIDAPAPSNANA
jgi:hypothetical protein